MVLILYGKMYRGNSGWNNQLTYIMTRVGTKIRGIVLTKIKKRVGTDKKISMNLDKVSTAAGALPRVTRACKYRGLIKK